jgi:hypothetical protein
MFKRLFDFAYALISLAFLLSFGIAIAKAHQGNSPTVQFVFIPGIFNLPTREYDVNEEQVNNPQNLPEVGITSVPNTDGSLLEKTQDLLEKAQNTQWTPGKYKYK